MSSQLWGAGRTAVVADDEPYLREIMRDALVRQGFSVAEASDGEGVLSLLREGHVDVLISDILMPGLSGLDVVDRAREISPHTSSIVVTGQASVDAARGAARRGAYDCLPKPFTEQDLVQAVSSALERKAREKDLSRQRELEELFRLSQQVRQTECPWKMLGLTMTTIKLQTGSDVAAVATVRDGKLWPLLDGEMAIPADRAFLADDDLLAVGAALEAATLYTRRANHPLAEHVQIIREAPVSVLGPVSEAIVCPVYTGKHRGGAIAVGRREADAPYTRGDLQLLEVMAAQCGLLVRNADLIDDLQRAYVGTVHSMARMVEARDKYTHGHSRRVADICRRLGQAMQVHPDHERTLETAAGLHDIGKLAVPDSVLNKPGRLNDTEWASIKMHPSVGAQVLAPAAFLGDCIPLVLHHHERYDGSGYPDRVSDGEIPLLAHIIIAADAWDAMTSDRPYRPALSVDQAIREISAGRGSQFHPDVADAVVELFARGVDLSYGLAA